MLRSVYTLCAFLWLFVIWSSAPQGYNYAIYQYNADLTISNVSAYSRPFREWAAVSPDRRYQLASYLDYPGAQHFVYVCLTRIGAALPEVLSWNAGFQLWQLLWVSVVLLLLALRSAVLPAIVMTFQPIFMYCWVVGGWEDKIQFVAIPLFVAVLLERKCTIAAAVAIGFSVGLNCLLVLFVPGFLLYVFRHDRSNLRWAIMALSLSLFVMLLPYFPESLSGWKYRSVRMGRSQPFWFSGFLLIKGIYFSRLNSIIMLAGASAATWFYFKKRITIMDLLLASVALLILCDIAQVIPRVLPLILLAFAFTPGLTKLDAAVLIAALCIYFFLVSGLSPANITIWHVVLFHVPIVYAGSLYVYRRQKQSA